MTGVSMATISRALSNPGKVRPATRMRIEAAIRELQYTPNELARNLFHNKTNMIAVIVPDVANPFYATLVNEIEKNLRVHGYKTMLCNTVGEKTNEEIYLNMLQRNMVDGILTATHSLDKHKYAGITGPVVSFDTPALSDRAPVITVDHEAGGRMAATLLLDSGCRKIVQFHDNVFDSFPFFKRHKEFKRCVEESGVECIDFIMEQDCFTAEFYEEIVEKCFEKHPDIDGVFATDMIALFCMKKISSLGKKVPEDVSIVSYDGTYMIDISTPSLTCIRQPIPEIARAGVEELIHMIQGEAPGKKEIMLSVRVDMGMTTKK